MQLYSLLKLPNKFSFNTVAFALSAAVIVIFINGYHFNSGDQAEHLPPVYKLMNPSLYPHDYYIEYFDQHFTVRYFYVYAVYALSFLMPVWLVCFMGTLLCMAGFIWFFGGVSVAFNRQHITYILSTLFVFVLTPSFTVGGNSIIETQFISGTIASLLASAVFYYFYTQPQRLVLMAIILAVSTMFHVVLGLQVFLIIAAYLLLMLRFKQFCLFLVSYLLPAMLVLVPVFLKQEEAVSVSTGFSFEQILVYFRNPNHYLPSAFPISHYFKTAVLASSSIYLLYINRQKEPYRKTLYLFIIIIVGLVVYTFTIEVMGWLWIARIQWFKTTIWLQVLGAIVWANVFAGSIAHLREQVILKATAGIAFIAIILMFNTALLPIKRLQGRYEIGNFNASSLLQTQEWMREHLPKETLVLSFPSDNSLACVAQLPQPVSWTAVVHDPVFMPLWYQKFQLAYHSPLQMQPFIPVKRVMDSNYYSTLPQLEFDYILVDINKCEYLHQLGPCVYQNGEFGVYKKAKQLKP